MINNLLNVQNGGLQTAALDQAEAEALQKTLQMGHPNSAGSNLVGGAAFAAESVDGVLRSVTYSAKNLVMWPTISQGKASAMVEQYIRSNSFGSQGSMYTPENGSPPMEDLSADRHSQKVVFMATRRGVSILNGLVATVGGEDPESRESSAGTLWLLEKLERDLYKGLAEFSNAGKFDGAISAIPSKLQNIALTGIEREILAGDQDLTAQSAAFQGYGAADTTIQDLAGDVVSETVIEDSANAVLENFGFATELHAPPKVMSDFVKSFFPKERVNALGMQNGRAGYVVNTFASSSGDIAMRPNVFLKPKDFSKNVPDRATCPSAAASATAALQADGATTLKAGDKYSYEVAACNEMGEGVAAAASAEMTIVSDGQAVALTIAQPTSGYAASHYAVYRTSKAGGAQRRKFVGYVAKQGANTIFLDRGAKIEGSNTAYLLDMRPEVITWKSLAPMMKIPLAQVSLSKEFILLMSGCMIMAAPRMAHLLKNIGRAA